MDENTQFIPDNDLPHSIEAEQCVLGAVLSDPSVAPLVIEKVKADYFYTEQHKAIYGIIVRMFTSGQPIDIVTVLNEAEKQHIFDTPAEGRRYLADIANTLPTTSNIESYCKIVADKYLIRSLGYTARAILEDIRGGEQDAALIIPAVNKVAGRLAECADAVRRGQGRDGKKDSAASVNSHPSYLVSQSVVLSVRHRSVLPSHEKRLSRIL